VSLVLIVFSICWWIYTSVSIDFALFKRGSLKYRIVEILTKLVYLKPFGVETVLRFDNPSEEVYERRVEGRKKLEEKLKCAEGDHVNPNMVDCRFQKVKVVMPLFKCLEVTNPNKIVKHEGSEVTLPSGKVMHYLSSDAVHFLGQKYYRNLQAEIAKRIQKNQTLFSPITVNPDLEQNVKTILGMTNMEGVRYHTSGSEAVDSAVRDVRKSTEKKYIVRFKNAYHGHTLGVTNEAPNQIYLDEMDEKSLDFIETYHYLIAGVIVNPMQFLGPNKLSPPGEKVTFKSRKDSGVTYEEYAKWLYDLNNKCKYISKYLTPIAFMMDDIYFGFRTPEFFSFKYFSQPDKKMNIDPDIIILGKGIAAGYPLSMVVGRTRFMNYYDKNYLLKVNRIVGTFSAYQPGIIASNVFLESIAQPKQIERIENAISRFNNFSQDLNDELQAKNVPVRIKNFSNTFNFLYLEDSIFNSCFPQYLMAQDIFLSYQSTGKFNFNEDWQDKDLEQLRAKIVDAAVTMKADGFFESGKLPWKKILKTILMENLRIRYDQIMHDKHIDIVVSHNHPVNKWTHFWSSIGMILFFYPFVFAGYPITAVINLLITQILRQIGHFFYEKQDRDAEKKKFGHKDGSKKLAAVGVAGCFLMYYYREYWISLLSLTDFVKASCALAFLPHFLEICHEFGFIRGFDWVLKIWTDPLTDVPDFYESAFISPKHFLDFNFSYKAKAKAKSL